MNQGTIGIISSGIRSGSLDTAAQAIIDAAEISNIQVRYAINKGVIDAKNHGWWDLCSAIYGFAGDNKIQSYQSQFKFNWKDPRDLDAAFRLSFLGGGWTFANTGATPNGTTSYADTFLVPSTILNVTDNHLSIYNRTNTNESSNNNRMIGVRSINGAWFQAMTIRNDSTDSDFVNGSNPLNSITVLSNTSAGGLYIDTRNSNTNHVIYKNGSNYGSESNDGSPYSLPNVSIYIGAANLGGTPGVYSNKECAFATIGAGVSSTIAALMYQDIQNFNSRLNRAVW